MSESTTAAGSKGNPVSNLVLFMSMSLDGFIAGPDDSVDNPFGTRGRRLHAWLGDGDSSGGQGHTSFRPAAGPSRVVFDEMMTTGAVVVGRRTIEQAGFWGGEHHDGVPVFIPTHKTPDSDPPGRLRYVTDGIESCVAQAKAAAGDRDVLLHGATTAQECLKAGLLDVLEIQLIPVLLGRGRRLFGDLVTEPIELHLVRSLQAPEALHLRYEVRYPTRSTE